MVKNTADVVLLIMFRHLVKVGGKVPGLGSIKKVQCSH